MTVQGREPAQGRERFICPSCDAFSAHEWSRQMTALMKWGGVVIADWSLATCQSCQADSLWRHDAMIWPVGVASPLAHYAMPADVADIYEEAREVAAISKRSAAALLRLALQMLVDELVEGSGTIDNKIGKLVARRLDPQIQQAMDVVRVVGNNAVHPGQIDLDADPEMLTTLFSLVNLVVEEMIARPMQINAMYGSLPQRNRDAIERRDAKAGD